MTTLVPTVAVHSGLRALLRPAAALVRYPGGIFGCFDLLKLLAQLVEFGTERLNAGFNVFSGIGYGALTEHGRAHKCRQTGEQQFSGNHQRGSQIKSREMSALFLYMPLV